ncbi:MAG: hypothetical protein QOG54_636 [Actinomycetota bacterium]|nr:hypothetical protein [Actinomycetota bacterium]
MAVVTRIAFGIVAYAANWYLSGDTTGAPQRGFIDIWVNWDALRFIATARFGYTATGAPDHATAFFPLYPLLIRAVSAIGFTEEIAGLLISFVASVVAFAYLFKLAEKEAGEGAGGRAVVYLALFPTAVFLIAPYSESLYLAGAIPAFYYARTRRWSLVGVPAAIAMGARFAGIFVLVGLGVEFLRQRDFSAKRLIAAGSSLVLGIGPLIAYAIYLAQVKGDPFFFFQDQKAGWGRALTNPVTALMNTIDRFDDPTQSTSFLFAYRIEVLAAAVGVACVVWAIGRKEWSYAAYMGSAMAVLMLSTEYFSIPRILLTYFPAFIFLAAATKERPGLHESLLAASTVTAAFGVIVYTHGSWFF